MFISEGVLFVHISDVYMYSCISYWEDGISIGLLMLTRFVFPDFGPLWMGSLKLQGSTYLFRNGSPVCFWFWKQERNLNTPRKKKSLFTLFNSEQHVSVRFLLYSVHKLSYIQGDTLRGVVKKMPLHFKAENVQFCCLWKEGYSKIRLANTKLFPIPIHPLAPKSYILMTLVKSFKMVLLLWCSKPDRFRTQRTECGHEWICRNRAGFKGNICLCTCIWVSGVPTNPQTQLGPFWGLNAEKMPFTKPFIFGSPFYVKN